VRVDLLRAFTEWAAVQRFRDHLKLTTVDRLHEIAAGDTVLDVGCGSGVVSDYLATREGVVYGLDTNPDAVESALAQFTGENLRFQLARAERLPFPDESVDAVVLFEVLEHLHGEQ
jgi:ubiquinone/menaquinone biosynthesis C-methylase UbiE